VLLSGRELPCWVPSPAHTHTHTHTHTQRLLKEGISRGLNHGFLGWALVAHSYNPSEPGGRDQKDRSLKPAQASSLRDPISKNPSQKRAGGVAQGEGPLGSMCLEHLRILHSLQC
jgi:hypothetical protein